MKRGQPRKVKRTTRRKRRARVVKVVMRDGPPVDVDAFVESYARLLIREAQEQSPTTLLGEHG